MIIRNARIVTLDSTHRILDCGAVQVWADGTIGVVAEIVPPARGERVVDAGGKLLMPALINAHTHLYSTLARGMRLHSHPPKNFPEILKKIWWRLDLALDKEDVYYSALVGLIDSAKAGVGTLFDHHSSPSACSGSLDVIEQAFREVGLRGSLCYETSDRHGAAKTAEAIRENVRFIKRARGNDDAIGAAFGLHASFTLSDRSLRRCVEANRSLGAGFHVHVAEDIFDVEHAQRRYHKSPVQRFADAGILDERTIAAHCVHVSAEDIECIASRGVNVVQNAQSNANNRVGTCNIGDFASRPVPVALGSDGFSPNMWEEFLMAHHVDKSRDREPGLFQYHSLLLHNREVAKKIWGWNVGRIETGARADLMLLDYYAPTPLTSDNLIGHLLFGISHAGVDSLMVNGKFVVRDHRCVNVDEAAISAEAAVRARRLWARM